MLPTTASTVNYNENILLNRANRTLREAATAAAWCMAIACCCCCCLNPPIDVPNSGILLMLGATVGGAIILLFAPAANGVTLELVEDMSGVLAAVLDPVAQ